jgi:hypothetical protein
MLNSVKGIYRNGKIELLEMPVNLSENTEVIVTFLQTNEIHLKIQGIEQEDAKKLQASLATFADDWNSSEMSIYDDYDVFKSQL